MPSPRPASGSRATAETPSIANRFRESMATVEQAPCDILLAVHPAFAGMGEKLRRRATQPEPGCPFIETGACRAYAEDARKRLEARVAEEQK